jgi:hypothetical protein
MLFVQATNDCSTAPSCTLADQLERLHKPHLLKILPSVGQTPDDAHNVLYEAINQWEDDVFGFLDQYLRR